MYLLDILPRMQMNSDIFNEILNYSLDIAVAVLSISISIFTLSTAFIVDKKAQIRILGEKIKELGQSLTYAYELQACRNFIKKMRKIADTAILAAGSSVIILLLYIVFRQIESTFWIFSIVCIDVITLIFLALSIGHLSKWYIKQKN